VIRARQVRVRTRTTLVNAARGLTKSFGERLRKCGTAQAGPLLVAELSPEIRAAVARKLAVLLHQLWVSGEAYDPLRNSRPVGRSRRLVAVLLWRNANPTRSPRSGDCGIPPAPGSLGEPPESDTPVAAPTATRNAPLAPSPQAP